LTGGKRYISSDNVSYDVEEAKSPTWSQWFVPYTPLMTVKAGDYLINENKTVLKVVKNCCPNVIFKIHNVLDDEIKISFKELEEQGYKLITTK